MACLYLHIGPHKTGSTYIQKQLCLHRDWLRLYGFNYPELGQDQWGHHKIVTWIQQQNTRELDGLKRALDLQFTQFENLVLSSENFELLTVEQIGQLKEAIGDKKVRVIYYARRWPGLLYSTWQENVKHSATEIFPEFVCSHLARPFHSPLLNYAVPLEKYERVFGKPAIQVVSYDNLLFEREDIFNHFTTAVLGLERSRDVHPEKVNASLGPETVEILRVLNALHASQGGRRASAPRKGFLELRKRRALPDLERLVSTMEPHRKTLKAGEGGFVNAAVVRHFLNQYGDRVANLAGNGGLFKEATDPKIEYVGQEYLLDEAVPALVRNIYAAVRNADSQKTVPDK